MDTKKLDVVLVRMDKIGDLVVSLGVDQHPGLEGLKVHWLICNGLQFITDQALPKRSSTEFRRGFRPFEFMRLLRWLKTHQPQTIVLFHAPWWVSLAAWIANVPERIGRRSQWHSYLWLNVGVRQKRSLSDRHESDYNFDLLETGLTRLGLRKTLRLGELKRQPVELVPPNPLGTLGALKLRPREYRVVHPGMAGSALNWPSGKFRELIEALIREREQVVITGTTSDTPYLSDLHTLREKNNIRWLVGELKPFQLLDVLSMAKSVIAPSTGVLHLAAGLGTPVVGIYSPRSVEHPVRWGPRGPRTAVLLPDWNGEGKINAQVMDRIAVSDVQKQIQIVESKIDLPAPQVSANI